MGLLSSEELRMIADVIDSVNKCASNALDLGVDLTFWDGDIFYGQLTPYDHGDGRQWYFDARGMPDKNKLLIPVRDSRVEIPNMSVRGEKTLARAMRELGWRYVSDIDGDSLGKIKNCGCTTVVEIMEWVNKTLTEDTNAINTTEESQG